VGDVAALTDAVLTQLASPRESRNSDVASETLGEENLDATLRLYDEMLSP